MRKRKGGPWGFIHIFHSHSTSGQRKNNDPDWINFHDRSVPVNITVHAGAVRSLRSVCPLHADTIRMAAHVFLSHIICLATCTPGRVGQSDVIGGDRDPQDTER